MNEITFIDLFRGIGGFHKGLTESGGYRCVWGNDIDKYASIIYESRFPETPGVTGDIRGVNTEEIPDHDLICAGFPCQSFSTAGRRKGFEDTRGTLFFEICRIAEAKRPKLLLLENVKGLLNHDGGRTFTVILQALDELGYWVEWQVLNSKYFGVPQNRERVFIIGHLRGTGGREVFPIGEASTGIIQGSSTSPVVRTLTAGGHSGGMHLTMTLLVEKLNRKHSLALDAHYGAGVSLENYLKKGIRTLVMAVQQPNQDNKKQNGRQIKTPDEPMNSRPSDKFNILDRARVRRLTPTECERLQGFPDGWTIGVSNTQRYKCLGNAVSVPVIKFLGDRIKEVLS